MAVELNDELATWLWAVICSEDSTNGGSFALFAEPARSFRANSARLAALRSMGLVTSEREPMDGGTISWWHPTDEGRRVMTEVREGRGEGFPNGIDWIDR